jgi:hypothetical protein
MLGQIPGVAEPALIGFSGYRQRPLLQACLNELSNEWPQYLAWAQGIFIRNAAGTVEDVRLLGFKEKLMQIRLDDDKK